MRREEVGKNNNGFRKESQRQKLIGQTQKSTITTRSNTVRGQPNTEPHVRGATAKGRQQKKKGKKEETKMDPRQLGCGPDH